MAGKLGPQNLAMAYGPPCIHNSHSVRAEAVRTELARSAALLRSRGRDIGRDDRSRAAARTAIRFGAFYGFDFAGSALNSHLFQNCLRSDLAKALKNPSFDQIKWNLGIGLKRSCDPTAFAKAVASRLGKRQRKRVEQ